MMSKLGIKDIVMRFCIAVLIFFMATFFARITTKACCRIPWLSNKLIIKSDNKTLPPLKYTNIDWSKIYKFKNNTIKNVSLENNTLTKLNDTIIANLKKYSSDSLWGYASFIYAERLYENIITWDLAPISSFVKLKDGYITRYFLPSSLNAKPLINFAKFCKIQNINFMYIQAPGKISKYDDSTITGILDFSNLSADTLLLDLKKNDIATLDLRELIKRGSHRNLFYKTDHHWKAETGLWAAKIITQKLNEYFELQLDTSLLNYNNYEFKIYKNWFLGSGGKKLTLAKTRPEDFTLIYPKFETSLQIKIPNIGLDSTGDFSIIYDMRELEIADYMHKNPYGAYCYRGGSLTHLKNFNNSNSKKLLVIIDSYAICVVPFLSLTVEYLDILDLRYFNGSVETYIETTKPDIVIVQYNPSGLNNAYDQLFNFN